jgi:hypothetical protein
MEINREEPEVQFYLAYYMNGDEMKTAVIPIRLKEKFLEKFKDNPMPSKIEIFKFLDSHD